MADNPRCCDNCKHFHWYFDYCDWWNSRVNWRAAYACFEATEQEGNDG